MKPKEMSPFLLLAVLNCPIVKKQIRSKQFTQDIIDTLGRRIHELILPIPKEFEVRKDIIKKTERIVSLRAELRQLAREVSVQVQGRDSLSPEDRILVGLT
jgi:type I restriction enzyme M protein